MVRARHRPLLGLQCVALRPDALALPAQWREIGDGSPQYQQPALDPSTGGFWPRPRSRTSSDARRRCVKKASLTARYGERLPGRQCLDLARYGAQLSMAGTGGSPFFRSPDGRSTGSKKKKRRSTACTSAARKSIRILDYRECYFFAAPDRQRQILASQPSTTPMLERPNFQYRSRDAAVRRLHHRIVNTFAGEARRNCERKAGERAGGFNPSRRPSRADKKIFEAIKASNFMPRWRRPSIDLPSAAPSSSSAAARARPIECWRYRCER